MCLPPGRSSSSIWRGERRSSSRLFFITRSGTSSASDALDHQSNRPFVREVDAVSYHRTLASNASCAKRELQWFIAVEVTKVLRLARIAVTPSDEILIAEECALSVMGTPIEQGPSMSI